MAATELEVPLLASFCSLPETSITTLLDAPTSELVKNLLTNIAVKAREFDEAKSQQLKLTVELENAIRGGEAKSRVLKGSLEKAQKESADLRQKVEDEGTA
jgi:nucleoprotein TPR